MQVKENIFKEKFKIYIMLLSYFLYILKAIFFVYLYLIDSTNVTKTLLLTHFILFHCHI